MIFVKVLSVLFSLALLCGNAHGGQEEYFSLELELKVNSQVVATPSLTVRADTPARVMVEDQSGIWSGAMFSVRVKPSAEKGDQVAVLTELVIHEKRGDDWILAAEATIQSIPTYFNEEPAVVTVPAAGASRLAGSMLTIALVVQPINPDDLRSSLGRDDLDVPACDGDLSLYGPGDGRWAPGAGLDRPVPLPGTPLIHHPAARFVEE